MAEILVERWVREGGRRTRQWYWQAVFGGRVVALAAYTAGAADAAEDGLGA